MSEDKVSTVEDKILPEPMITTTAQEATQVPTQEVQERTPLIGYVVALLSDGNFHFEVLGSQKGLVELLGVHEYAGGEVRKVYNNTLWSGDKLVRELGELVNSLHKKVDRLEDLVRNQLKGVNQL